MQSAILGDRSSKRGLEITELPEIIQIDDNPVTIRNTLDS